jgi:hypothetical protein
VIVGEQKKIHWTELPEDTSGGPLSTEANVYRREVGRLLAEGHEGQWVLIKGEEIFGTWKSHGIAVVMACEYGLQWPVLIRQVLEWELYPPLEPAPRDEQTRRWEEAREFCEGLAKQGKAVHWTKLSQETSGSLATEWNFYLREIGRLLAEGHEGRWLLIKGQEIIGIWDTYEEASTAAAERYSRQPVFVHRILEYEPLIRPSLRWYLWHNSRSQS